MPGSNCSGFSTASKQAIESLRIENATSLAAKDAEMESERKKRDAEMEAMRSQMAEMSKIINGIQVQDSGRGRGRGRGQAARGGGRGRQSVGIPVPPEDHAPGTKMISRSESKKRSCDNKKNSTTSLDRSMLDRILILCIDFVY